MFRAGHRQVQGALDNNEADAFSFGEIAAVSCEGPAIAICQADSNPLGVLNATVRQLVGGESRLQIVLVSLVD